MRGEEERRARGGAPASLRKRGDALVERSRYDLGFCWFVGPCVPNEFGMRHMHPQEGPCAVLLSNFPSCEEAQLRLWCGQEATRHGCASSENATVLHCEIYRCSVAGVRREPKSESYAVA